MPDGTQTTSEDLKKMLQEVKQHSASIKSAVAQKPELLNDLSDEERGMILDGDCTVHGSCGSFHLMPE